MSSTYIIVDNLSIYYPVYAYIPYIYTTCNVNKNKIELSAITDIKDKKKCLKCFLLQKRRGFKF